MEEQLPFMSAARGGGGETFATATEPSPSRPSMAMSSTGRLNDASKPHAGISVRET